MKSLVRVCALYNACAFVAFLTPGLLPAAGVVPPSPFWLWLPALLALSGATMLWLSAANLRRYGAFPYWNGIVRVVFALVVFALDLPASAGAAVTLIALGDLALGLACVLGLPRATGRTHLQLLSNRDADGSQ